MKDAMHSTLILPLCLCLCLAVPVQADTPDPDVHMIIRQVSHSVGLKGGELAQRLGLPGQVD